MPPSSITHYQVSPHSRQPMAACRRDALVLQIAVFSHMAIRYFIRSGSYRLRYTSCVPYTLRPVPLLGAADAIWASVLPCKPGKRLRPVPYGHRSHCIGRSNTHHFQISNRNLGPNLLPSHTALGSRYALDGGDAAPLASHA